MTAKVPRTRPEALDVHLGVRRDERDEETEQDEAEVGNVHVVADAEALLLVLRVLLPEDLADAHPGVGRAPRRRPEDGRVDACLAFARTRLETDQTRPPMSESRTSCWDTNILWSKGWEGDLVLLRGRHIYSGQVPKM